MTGLGSDKVRIRNLSSGVDGLDEVLGGGIPELSFNLIVGGPGCGKTTLGTQIAFANGTPDRPAIHIGLIGEPPLKMLRYQQQYSFFDPSKVGSAVRFLHLGDEARSGGLAHVLERIAEEVTRANPTVVVVDSFRTVVEHAKERPRNLDMQDFIQRLALHLTACEATTFLLGEYEAHEQSNPVFTIADGIVLLRQSIERNSIVRKLQVVKMRGQGQIPGLHTVRITSDGLVVFPRLLKPEEASTSGSAVEHRVKTGIAPLDEMLGGGIPRGYSVLVAGPSGSGKTVLSNEFILEGARLGEPGIIAVFEKRPNDYVKTTPHGREFEKLIAEKKLEIIYLRPLDLSIDEALLAIRTSVARIGAKRAVIDSLSGLELALAPTFREDFRESLYRMVGALTSVGVTVLSTVELSDSFTDLRFSPHGIAFLTDVIIMQRYIELDGVLARVMSVVKVRGSNHSKELRQYEITGAGALRVGQVLKGYEGLLSGKARTTLDHT